MAEQETQASATRVCHNLTTVYPGAYSVWQREPVRTAPSGHEGEVELVAVREQDGFGRSFWVPPSSRPKSCKEWLCHDEACFNAFQVAIQAMPSPVFGAEGRRRFTATL